ncbi:hypothetical protein DF058_15860 [Burkholderia cenocepacia]|nr:hypothetical protein DF058_15860 [Burkholderia cenocepacia]RRA14985.1 hypothetical protein DF059_15995 [Burkholderia cenocepacia]
MQRKLRKGRKTALLRAYLNADRHLRDDTKGLTLSNTKTLEEITRETGFHGSAEVSRMVRREFPDVAAIIALRDPQPDRKAPKKDRLIRFIADGGHLRDASEGLTSDNLLTQAKIASELGMSQGLVSYHLRQHFPDISAVMAERRRHGIKE